MKRASYWTADWGQGKNEMKLMNYLEIEAKLEIIKLIIG